MTTFFIASIITTSILSYISAQLFTKEGGRACQFEYLWLFQTIVKVVFNCQFAFSSIIMQKKNGLLKITTEKPSKYFLMCQNIADLVKCCICKNCFTKQRHRPSGKWLRLAQSGISDEDYWTLDNRAEYKMQLATVHKVQASKLQNFVSSLTKNTCNV